MGLDRKPATEYRKGIQAAAAISAPKGVGLKKLNNSRLPFVKT
jgi:hypothetical protein